MFRSIFSVIITHLSNLIESVAQRLLPSSLVKKVSIFSYVTFRDIRFLLKGLQLYKLILKYKAKGIIITDLFYKCLELHPDKNCLLFEDQQWTFRDVEKYSNRVGSYFRHLSKGDVVCLMLPNMPEYTCIWFGLAKIGVISSFVNTNLKLKPLLHSINVVKPKAIIYSREFESALSEIKDSLENHPRLFCFEGDSAVEGSEDFVKVLESSDHEKFQRRLDIGFDDTIIYISTSGTTGLPKPVVIKHSKMVGLFLMATALLGLQKDEIVYTPLPMYHLATTTITATSLSVGVTTVLKKKFSASSFISDCQKYNVTCAQYIGEMMRYLLATKEQPGEKNNNLRRLIGNGLRPEVWTKVLERFNIPLAVEYYGATESNFIVVNVTGKTGSCGFLPIGIPGYHLRGPSIIKYDQEISQPVRGKDGFCILAEPGEVGLMIGYCPAGNELRKFHGYISKKETDAKCITNVFKANDKAFSSGDLLIMDERGWLYFQDRLGDTFRWKGENVSTTEVESVIYEFPGVEDCAVYGVPVFNIEGKAGMAAMKMSNADLEGFTRHLELSLPPYAQPLFLRFVDSLELTSTFKLIKTQLKTEAFDVDVVRDPLYVKLNGKYTPISSDIYNDIQSGKFKL